MQQCSWVVGPTCCIPPRPQAKRLAVPPYSPSSALARVSGHTRSTDGCHWRPGLAPASASAGGGWDGGSGDEPVDIDALAARLAAEAERLRRRGELPEGGLGAEEEEEGQEGPVGSRRRGSGSGSSSGAGSADLLSPFGSDSRRAEAEVFVALGDGGFSSQVLS